MGKKGGWFSSIKRTLSPSSKKRQKSLEEHHVVPDTPNLENASGSCDSHSFPPPEEVKPIVVEDEPPQHAYSVAGASGATTSTAVAATTSLYSGKSKEERAAIRIQSVFRSYLVRRALWNLRGLDRLKKVVEGTNVKRQTANTLKCTKILSHLHSQINSRRIRMSEENQALQKQLIRAKELENMQNGDEWNYSVQSKEEIEAKLLSKYEATMRRERAMAYSFTHQQPWRKSTGTTNMLFMDPTNPQWGWSWSERYVPRGEKDSQNDQTPNKSGITITRSEIAKSYARHQLNSAPSTPRSKAGGPVASRKPKPGPSPRAHGSGVEASLDDDSKSVVSVQSERNRRHSVGGSMVKNGESLPSSPAARKRMVLAKSSAKAKPREEGLSESGEDGGNIAMGSGGNVKKQLTYPKRNSGPPKAE